MNSGYNTDIAVGPSNPSIAYATYHAIYNAADGSIYKSTNGGERFTQISTNLPAGHRLLELHVSPTNADILLVLSGKGRFYCGPAFGFQKY